MNIHKQLALGKSIAGGAQVGDLGSAYILFCLHCVGAALPSPEDRGNCPWQDGDFSSSPLALNTEFKVHWQQPELVAQREAYQVALHIHLLWELGSIKEKNIFLTIEQVDGNRKISFPNRLDLAHL